MSGEEVPLLLTAFSLQNREIQFELLKELG